MLYTYMLRIQVGRDSASAKAVIFSTKASKKDTQDTPQMLRVALYHTKSWSKTTTIINSCFHFDNQLRKLPSICIKNTHKEALIPSSFPAPFPHGIVKRTRHSGRLVAQGTGGFG